MIRAGAVIHWTPNRYKPRAAIFHHQRRRQRMIREALAFDFREQVWLFNKFLREQLGAGIFV